MIAYTIYLNRENYATGNDLAWAAGLKGDCTSCGEKIDFNFADPNLMSNTLVSTIQPQAVDYYGRPRYPLYYGNALQDQIIGKVWTSQ